MAPNNYNKNKNDNQHENENANKNTLRHTYIDNFKDQKVRFIRFNEKY